MVAAPNGSQSFRPINNRAITPTRHTRFQFKEPAATHDVRVLRRSSARTLKYFFLLPPRMIKPNHRHQRFSGPPTIYPMSQQETKKLASTPLGAALGEAHTAAKRKRRPRLSVGLRLRKISDFHRNLPAENLPNPSR